MSNLVPQKRMDKTGRLVTRHIKADASNKLSASLANAAPQLAKKAPASKRKKPTSKQLVFSQHVLSDWNGCDPDLIQMIKDKKKYAVVRTICDVQIYDVASTVKGMGNVVALLAGGATSRESAQEMLSEAGLEHLIVDNTEFIDDLFNRRVAGSVFLDKKVMIEHNATENLADALEVASSSCAVMTRHVLDGSISLSDIKAVGYTKLNKAPYASAFLRDMQQNGIVSPKDLSDILEGSYTETSTKKRYEMVKRHGSFWADNGYVNNLTIQLSDALIEDGVTDNEEVNKTITYAQELEKALFMKGADKPKVRGYIDMYRANAPIEDIASGKMTIEQVMAAKNGEVTSSVASGWL